MERILISIAIICYNQVEYISEAIESVLSQEHPYDFEIIISDDCSIDGTKELLETYRRKYPNFIKLILRTNNVGPSRNIYELLLECKGKYIALLEGDDYWTDNSKISKQVDFLEKNTFYIGCSHRYQVVDENSSDISYEYFGPGRPLSGDYTIDDFRNYIYFGLLGSVLFRNIVPKMKKQFAIIKTAHSFISDITLNLLLILNGGFFVMDYNMAAHRIIVKKNGTNFKSLISTKNQVEDRIKYQNKLEEFVLVTYKINLLQRPRNESLCIWSILYLMKYPSKHNWNSFIFSLNLIENRWTLIDYFYRNINKVPRVIYSQFKKILNHYFFKK